MYDNLLANVPTDLWIGGKWRKSSDGGRFDVIDPATENKVASVASATVEDAKAALDAASAAFPGWAAKKPRERGEILRKAFELIMRDAERLAKLITIENGKALSDSRGEVAYSAEFFRWYAEEAVRNIGAKFGRPGLRRAHPGAPQAGRHRGAGDAVEFSGRHGDAQDRPGARRRLPGRAQARLRYAAHHAGADADPRGSRRAGRRRQRHSVALLRQGGRRDAARSARARRLLHRLDRGRPQAVCTRPPTTSSSPAMELGGNAPFIVFDDADIDAAIEGAMIAKMRNMGEACTAANRFYVHEKVHDEFAKKLTAKMAGLKMGNGLDDGVALGPLVNQEGRDKVIELVDDAVKKGAKVLTGGKTPSGPGFFYPATVLTNVSNDAKMLNEEIFGPVASMQTFKSEDEVITRANDTEYGLVAYLYTKDLSRGCGSRRSSISA